MEKTFKLGTIGAGFMGHAILQGAVEKGYLKKEDIIVSDPNEEHLKNFSSIANTTTDNRYVAENSEYLLLCVKPQAFPMVAENLKGISIEKVISIMAGKKKEYISSALGGVKVARVMPNLPCSIGYGMVAVDASDFSQENQKFVMGIFQSIAEVLSVKEEKMDAVTSISGSGPAYVYLFIESLIQAGIKQGLTQEEAYKLSIETVIGGAQMVKHTKDKSISELISAVCSKGGTTIEAMNSFEKDNFSTIVERAVDCCAKRSKELSK